MNETTLSTGKSEAFISLKAAALFVFAFGLYFLTHSPALDEIDSVQFAMGIRDFNLWAHQPHPPGYPLFIFLGWIGAEVLRLSPETSLYLVSSLGGALFIASWFLILRLQFNERLAWWVALSLTVTPAVWMTATKVLSDSLATGLLSAEILAALYFLKRGQASALLAAGLFGAAAAGARPQLILVVCLIMGTALKQRRGGFGNLIVGWSSLLLGCLLWLLPMCYLQARLRSDVSFWAVYPRLVYGQWLWRMDKPSVYLGAGDWSPHYLAWRLVAHFLGWLGLGFGFLQSTFAMVAGVTFVMGGLFLYFWWEREPEDREFWRFHRLWALVHIAVIFICLPPDQRYYLIIFPLLLVGLLRGFLRLRPYWNWLALVLPLLLLGIVIPLAIENHREAAPPMRVVAYLERLYPPQQRKKVALLLVAARRHAEWYAPEFKTFGVIPPPADLPRLLADFSAVYTDNPQIKLPPGWRRVPLVLYRRPFLVHMKNHSVTLFLIDRPLH